MKYRLHHTIICMQICAMTNLGRCLHLNSNVRELESVERSWWRLVVHLKKKNIAKGTTDPRVHVTSSYTNLDQRAGVRVQS